MTIKQFALLCECNPQTLRYYDSVDLLKPVQVDQWSGYRYYEEEQAVTFVKIKNLQRAGFSIEEIKNLLDQDNAAIVLAFDAKIAEQEQRLQEIKHIRQSYQAEMTDMQKKLEALREEVRKSMEAYDPEQEFGIDRAAYDEMIGRIVAFINGMISRNDGSDMEFSEYHEGNQKTEEPEYVRLLNDPEREIVYEKHGWQYVRDFFSELPTLEDGRDYDMVFHLLPGKANGTAFANTAVNLLLQSYPRDAKNRRCLGCTVSDTKDDQNHFWLLKRKE